MREKNFSLWNELSNCVLLSILAPYERAYFQLHELMSYESMKLERCNKLDTSTVGDLSAVKQACHKKSSRKWGIYYSIAHFKGWLSLSCHEFLRNEIIKRYAILHLEVGQSFIRRIFLRSLYVKECPLSMALSDMGQWVRSLPEIHPMVEMTLLL